MHHIAASFSTPDDELEKCHIAFNPCVLDALKLKGYCLVRPHQRLCNHISGYCLQRVLASQPPKQIPTDVLATAETKTCAYKCDVEVSVVLPSVWNIASEHALFKMYGQDALSRDPKNLLSLSDTVFHGVSNSMLYEKRFHPNMPVAGFSFHVEQMFLPSLNICVSNTGIIRDCFLI